jgi:hypothetical protein
VSDRPKKPRKKKPPKPEPDMRWRRVTDLWSQRWKSYHPPGSKYPWDIHVGPRGGRGGADFEAGERLVGTARIHVVNGEEALVRLGKAMDLYLREARDGIAWPQGQPPTLACFASQAPKYLQRIDHPEVISDHAF